MSDFIATMSCRPGGWQLVDWISPSGDQVIGGKYHGGLWFLPPDHSVYCYYVPVAWRPHKDNKESR